MDIGGDRVRLLYVTHFFPPEKGAAANRAYRIATELVKLGYQVDVVTGFPNYPNGVLPASYKYRGTVIYDSPKGFRVIRVPVQPAANDESLILRLVNQFSLLVYALMRRRYLRCKYDVVFASSPPLFTGLLGWILAGLTGASFVLDVRDLWPQAGAEAMGAVGRVAMAPFDTIAKFLYKNASLITVTADTMREVISKYTNTPVFWFPNGVLKEEKHRVIAPECPTRFCLVSAGILGRLQDNELLRDVAWLLPHYMHLDIVGGGVGARYFSERNTPDNVRYWGVLPHEDTLRIIGKSHMGLALWKNYRAARYVIPMRVVEYLNLGKPVILTTPTAVGSLIKEYNAGLVLGSCDAGCLVDAVSELLGDTSKYEKMVKNALYLADTFFDMRKNVARFTRKLKEVL